MKPLRTLAVVAALFAGAIGVAQIAPASVAAASEASIVDNRPEAPEGCFRIIEDQIVFTLTPGGGI